MNILLKVKFIDFSESESLEIQEYFKFGLGLYEIHRRMKKT